MAVISKPILKKIANGPRYPLMCAYTDSDILIDVRPKTLGEDGEAKVASNNVRSQKGQ